MLIRRNAAPLPLEIWELARVLFPTSAILRRVQHIGATTKYPQIQNQGVEASPGSRQGQSLRLKRRVRQLTQ